MPITTRKHDSLRIVFLMPRTMSATSGRLKSSRIDEPLLESVVVNNLHNDLNGSVELRAGYFMFLHDFPPQLFELEILFDDPGDSLTFTFTDAPSQFPNWA